MIEELMALRTKFREAGLDLPELKFRSRTDGMKFLCEVIEKNTVTMSPSVFAHGCEIVGFKVKWL